MSDLEINTVIFRDTDGNLKYISPNKIIATVKIVFEDERTFVDIKNKDSIPMEYEKYTREILGMLSDIMTK